MGVRTTAGATALTRMLCGPNSRARYWVSEGSPALAAQPDLFVVSREMLVDMVSQNPGLAEIHEMLYQYEEPYLLDSSKFNQAYDFTPTSYTEGMRQAVADFQRRSPTA